MFPEGIHMNHNSSTIKNRIRVIPTLLVLISALLAFAPQIVLADFEKPGTLSAKSILPAEVIKGKYHTVEEVVQNDGMFNHYRVNSDFGDFEVVFTNSVRILVNEIHAIAAMKAVETEDMAVAALKQSGENTVSGLKNIYDDPKGALQGAASGVGSLFNRASKTLGRKANTDTEDSKFEQLIGISKSKGEIATNFDVNVYSRNQVLQAELDRLARADYLGGLGVGAATSFVPGVGGLVLTTSGTARLLNEAINNTPASELWLQNKAKLIAAGGDEQTVELFLNNPHFSPALQTVIATAIESMKGVESREFLVKVGLQATDADMAQMITQMVVLIAGYNKNIAPLQKILPFERTACALNREGKIVLLLPMDHIIWSENVAAIAHALPQKLAMPATTEIEVWNLGDFSNKAQGELEKLGWKVEAKAGNKLMPSKK
jgi:hypothetical protein